MFSKFCVTRSKNAKFSSLLQRLGSCFSSRVLSLAIAAVVAAPLSCVAGTIPEFSATYPLWQVHLDTTYTGISANAPGDYAFGGVAVTASPGPPSPLLAVSVCCGGVPSQFEGDASLMYQFAVTGPVDNLIAPMWVTITEHSSGIGASNQNDGGAASFQVSGYSVVQGTSMNVVACNENHCGAQPPGQATDFSGTLPFTVLTNAVGFISMSANAGTVGGGFAAGSIDPFIFIDPVWLSSNPGYSVIVSAGIGNAATDGIAVPEVPEPATLALLGLGLAGMGLSRRRHQRKS